MNITHAIITAVGRGMRDLSLHRLIDSDNRSKAAIQIVVEEAVAAGVDNVAIIVRPGDESAFRAAAGDTASRLAIIPQPAPLGHGHAVLCGRRFVGDQPFLEIDGGAVYVSNRFSDHPARRCAEQLVAVASVERCTVSAVQIMRDSMRVRTGPIVGCHDAGAPDLYEVQAVIGESTFTTAERSLVLQAGQTGHCRCFFGMHVLPPTIFDLLDPIGQPGHGRLSPALARLAERERYLAFQVHGHRYSLDRQHGLLIAQIALRVGGRDRSETLARLVDLLARDPQPG